MEPDEGVRVQPVPAHAVPAIDQDNVDVCIVDKSVREGQPNRTRADHQVVRLEHRKGHGLHADPFSTSRSTGPGAWNAGWHRSTATLGTSLHRCQPSASRRSAAPGCS
jgi:hypothetical protein